VKPFQLGNALRRQGSGPVFGPTTVYPVPNIDSPFHSAPRDPTIAFVFHNASEHREILVPKIVERIPRPIGQFFELSDAINRQRPSTELGSLVIAPNTNFE
jgi:hypothetical protein